MKTITLTRDKVALVDDEDYEWLSQWKWCAYKPLRSKTFYAVRGSRINGKSRLVPMHRAILNPDPKVKVDHRNGDGLDNRRDNLRVCTNAQNGMNKRFCGKRAIGHSKYKGVAKSTGAPTWRAYIRPGGRQIHLGTFVSEEDAARAYDAAAKVHFGEFACPNFNPPDVLPMGDAS